MTVQTKLKSTYAHTSPDRIMLEQDSLGSDESREPFIVLLNSQRIVSPRDETVSNT